MLEGLLRTKTLEQLRDRAEDPGNQLKRRLSAFDLTMLGIGAIVGAGIFSTIGTAAAGNLADGRLGAGPALIVSFALTALACLFTAICYAELSSMIPVSGSAYTYAYATLGELAAWIIGWDLVLEYAVSNVAVAISWGDYARSFLANIGLNVPGWLAVDPRSALLVSERGIDALQLDGQPGFGASIDLLAQAHLGAIDGASIFANWDRIKDAPMISGCPVTINLLAVVITVTITALCYWGIKESARANAIMVVLKMALLLAVIALGFRYITADNWTPFAPNGFKGIQAGAAIIFFAFIGFDAVSTTAQECRNPGRDMPRGILWSLAICAVLYIAVTAVVTGMVSYTELGGKADPLAYVFERHGLTGLAGLISLGAMVATAACLLVFQIGQPRILMAMSNDGLLGPWFGKVHPKHGTPGNATILTGLVVAVPAALLNIDEVVELSNIGTLFAFAIVCVGVMILRVRRPDAPRGFKVPGAWIVAPLGILSCGWLAIGLPSITFVRFIIWLALGLIVYLIYGARNSRVREAAAKVIADDGDGPATTS